jgi:hypothetical protein
LSSAGRQRRGKVSWDEWLNARLVKMHDTLRLNGATTEEIDRSGHL